MVSIKYGLGRHLADVVPADRPLATKYCFIAAIVYIALSYLVKVIVGIFLVRICSGKYSLAWDICTQQDTDLIQASHQKWQRITIWSMLGVVGLFYGAYFFIAIFACRMYCPFYPFVFSTFSALLSMNIHTTWLGNDSNIKQSP